MAGVPVARDFPWPPDAPGAWLTGQVCGGVLLIVALELAGILIATHGVFSYTLDDPYIHLALSRRLQAGTYGINPGEWAAPSSSILWPLFFAAVPAQIPGWVLLPVLINTAGVLVTAMVFCDVLRIDQRLPPWKTACLVLGLTISLNLAGLVVCGMEHGLQLALTALGLWGLIEEERTGRLPRAAILALVLGPWVRYENVAITAGACACLFAQGRWRPAAAVLAATALGMAGFSLFLASHGLAPLPTSVLAKGDAVQRGLLGALAANTLANLRNPAAWVLVLLALAAARRLRHAPPPGDRRLAVLAVVAAALHLIGGGFGHFARYEAYILTTELLILIALYRQPITALLRARTRPRAFMPLLAVMLAALLFPRQALTLARIPTASRDIYLQQMQMARFARDYWQRPVAVNDLGAVALASNSYVLDYMGLASAEALRARHDRENQWMDQLAQAHEVGLAMIYRAWFQDLPPSWTLVAQLHLHAPRITPGDCVVGFYATAPAVVSELRGQLARFGQELPHGATLEMVDSPPREVLSRMSPVCPR